MRMSLFFFEKIVGLKFDSFTFLDIGLGADKSSSCGFRLNKVGERVKYLSMTLKI